MQRVIKAFLREESAAISVDYVVLSAAAVAMAIAATDVIKGGERVLTSDLEAQLRSQQISDSFVTFTSSHFDALYDSGVVSEEQASDLFDSANEMMNSDILNALADGIEKMVNETITDEELAELFAIASVAYQRNIVDDEIIEYYFSSDGGYYSSDTST